MQKNNFTNGEKGTHNLIVRLSPSQHQRVKAMAQASGYNTISSFIRSQVLQPSIEMKLNNILKILGNGEVRNDNRKNKGVYTTR